MGLTSAAVLGAQALALLATAISAAWQAFWSLPVACITAVLRAVLPGCDGNCDGWARFYEVGGGGK